MNKIKIYTKGYSVIYTDCPWHYKDKLKHDNMRGAAEDHYPVLKPKDLKELDIGALAAKDCALFMWVTGPQFDIAIDCIRAWGFKFKTMAFVWRKMNKKAVTTPFYGLGRWTRSNYEYVLLATKGKPQRVSKGIRQEIVHPLRGHSAKPHAVREAIEDLMGPVPRIELFSRDICPGWHSTGFDVDGLDIRTYLKAYKIMKERRKIPKRKRRRAA